ncbi:hypothetical protein, partial [Nocardioides sp.]|uniref:hypothetical protein n=1 Tax=Nocardioides sp. TaxID=35761 RepID=UPI00321B398D
TYPMTFKQGQALARFIHELRTDWDVLGIESALQKARDRGQAHEVAQAAIRAAALASNRTPAVIPMDGAHWQAAAASSSTTYRPQRLQPHERCSTCQKPRARCEGDPRYGGDDHRFRPDVPAAGRPAWVSTDGELLDADAVMTQLRAGLAERHPDQPAADPSPDTEEAAEEETADASD